MYLLLALVIGFAVGLVACLPQPQTDLRGMITSVALGVLGSLLCWKTADVLGFEQMGPVAQLFVSIIGSVAIVSVYHAATSERSRLR